MCITTVAMVLLYIGARLSNAGEAAIMPAQGIHLLFT